MKWALFIQAFLGVIYIDEKGKKVTISFVMLNDKIDSFRDTMPKE